MVKTGFCKNTISSHVISALHGEVDSIETNFLTNFYPPSVIESLLCLGAQGEKVQMVINVVNFRQRTLL